MLNKRKLITGAVLVYAIVLIGTGSPLVFSWGLLAGLLVVVVRSY